MPDTLVYIPVLSSGNYAFYFNIYFSLVMQFVMIAFGIKCFIYVATKS
jgi:hypothetical protein